MTERMTAGSGAHENTVDGHGAAHPTDRSYVSIAVILAVLTAVEVATYYVDIGGFLLPVLLVLMVVKFVLVAGFFMHLRFDSNLFSRIFTAGVLLAIAVYCGFLFSFQYFLGE